MIHARADQEKNIKNAVADNISGYGYPEFIYYSAICIALKKWDSTFSRFWLATGIVGIAGSALIRLYGMPCIVETMIGISVCFLLSAEIKIIKGMHRKPLGKRKRTL